VQFDRHLSVFKGSKFLFGLPCCCVLFVLSTRNQPSDG